MSIFHSKIKEVLDLKDDVHKLLPLSSGWYVIQRTDNKGSRRYNLGVKKQGFHRLILLHDYKTQTTKSFVWKSKLDLNIVGEDNKPPDTRHTLAEQYYKTNSFKDNGYLKQKGLLDFNNHDVVNVNYMHYLNYLLLPYTNFDIYPALCGAKLIGPEGEKRAIQGSQFKFAFNAHRYNANLTSYIIGEGYPECCIAMNLLPYYNVLEAGGSGNVGNLLNILTQNPDNQIYVLGEYGSEHVYSELADTYPVIKVSYPPDKGCKDFGDYYLKAGANKTKEALLGILLEQNPLGYKPLGLEDTKPVFYSQILNGIVKLSAENTDSIFRFSTPNPAVAHKASRRVKLAAISKLFMECAQCGSYTPDNVLPVGLWRYKQDYFYNDGSKVIKLIDDKLQLVSYSETIRADFLLHKVPEAVPIDINHEFTAAEELVELISACDWLEPVYAKILLGFLIQSYYAGSLTFRPHLWIMSESSHAGKSWLSNWCTTYLVTNAFKRESGRSTSAGTAQAMSSLAGLLTADEFAEENTAYLSDAKRMIELLRSASTAQAPIVLGSPEQKPIRGHVRFSALLACIEGEQLLKKQDFDRIVVIRFGRKKGGFEEKIMPRFEDFVSKHKHLGFATTALKGWKMHRKLCSELHINLASKYEEIGHKSRGLASIIAGYAVLHNSEHVIEPFIKELGESKIIKPYIISADLIKEDMLERVLRMSIQEKYVDASNNTFNTVLNILRAAPDHQIPALGLKLIIEKKQLNLYCNTFRNFNEKYLKLDIHYLYKQLEASKYFVKIGNSNFCSKQKTRYFQFSLKDYMIDKKEETEFLKIT